MKNTEKKQSTNSNLVKRIKVQLDHKTMIIINKLSSLEVWKKLYPEAKIIK